jgi:hypothetical protein
MGTLCVQREISTLVDAAPPVVLHRVGQVACEVQPVSGNRADDVRQKMVRARADITRLPGPDRL